MGKLVTRFQDELPYRQEPYSRKGWGHPLHSLCSYQGKLKPAFAHWLVRRFVGSDATVLDPLGGVGTVAFEASLRGLKAISNDKSPLAALVAEAKLDPPTLEEAERAIESVVQRMVRISLTDADFEAATFGLNASVADYYHPATLEEVLRARKVFIGQRRRTRGETFVWASLLHVLHGNRPYALSRTSHPITPFHPTGPAQYRSLEEKVRGRVTRALTRPLPQEFRPGESVAGDFRLLTHRLASGSIDAIITSPPFIGMRFDRPNWLRLWFTGWAADDFHETSRGFLEREQVGSLDCYRDFFSVCNQLLVDSGLLVIHVGSGGRGDLIGGLRDLSESLFSLVGHVVEGVEGLDHHGIKDKGLTTQHHLLFLTKRDRASIPESPQQMRDAPRVAS